MSTIVVSENVTADGVMKDPTGEEGTAAGGWFQEVSGEDLQQWSKVLADEAFEAEAMLMGRGSYDYFVARGWLDRDGAWAQRLRDIPKYVLSSTLRDPQWSNTTVISGDPVEATEQLLREVDGTILVNASGRLVTTLWRAGLVDELRLVLFPTVVGGRGGFADPGRRTRLQLHDIRRIGDSLVQLRYAVTR
ncbi:MAG TPA: dihydrofolate reductase family protein [Flexivirga sp.]|uniref:dihydrofolate reductase family protein n=1 Tax=Flexivirga sp. TaxID=1962927 RepID=UPI002D09DE2A|nr:dihydrofolate reductase family protein [Flexivirga sp.]HWC23485.1 dihydrofolate reductase family protein [Flexivirga sp.]